MVFNLVAGNDFYLNVGRDEDQGCAFGDTGHLEGEVGFT